MTHLNAGLTGTVWAILLFSQFTCGLSAGIKFFLETSAGLLLSTFQDIGLNSDHIAAVAMAPPSVMPFPRGEWYMLFNHEPAKPLAAQIDKGSAHACIVSPGRALMQVRYWR